MAIMQIVISPKIREGESISLYVAEVHKVLKKSKFPYLLHDMGTLIEGDAGELYALARELHEIPFKMGLSRVYTSIQIDDRRDKVVHLGDKIKSVRNKMKDG
jgi:uncharacterized protein (TIGR00106 family)